MLMQARHYLQVTGAEFNLMVRNSTQVHINKTDNSTVSIQKSALRGAVLYLIVFTPVTAQDLCVMCWNHNSDSCHLHIPDPQSLIT